MSAPAIFSPGDVYPGDVCSGWSAPAMFAQAPGWCLSPAMFAPVDVGSCDVFPVTRVFSGSAVIVTFTISQFAAKSQTWKCGVILTLGFIAGRCSSWSHIVTKCIDMTFDDTWLLYVMVLPCFFRVDILKVICPCIYKWCHQIYHVSEIFLSTYSQITVGMTSTACSSICKRRLSRTRFTWAPSWSSQDSSMV